MFWIFTKSKTIILGSIESSDYPILFYGLERYYSNGSEDLVKKNHRLIIVPHEIGSQNLKRIHLVVTTNEDCWIIIEKQVFHLPISGSYFIVDTTKMHTAVNASDEGRIHIIGNIE